MRTSRITEAEIAAGRTGFAQLSLARPATLEGFPVGPAGVEAGAWPAGAGALSDPAMGEPGAGWEAEEAGLVESLLAIWERYLEASTKPALKQVSSTDRDDEQGPSRRRA